MSSLDAQAFWVVGPAQGELRREALRSPEPGELLIESLYSGVSRGTESLVFHAKVPPSEHAAMRGPHQAGEFPYPVKYGYMNVGRIVEGAGAGALVFCLHPHQDRYVVAESAVTPLPAALSPERAVLAANLETAINGVWDANPGPGDRIAVVGGGVVGCLMAYLMARIPGTEVTLVDPLPARARVAEALGLRWEPPEAAPGDQDLVVHASGREAGLRRALELAGREAQVIEMSWYGSREVTLPLGGPFHSRRLTLRSSQVGTLPPARQPRWTHRRRMQLALELLADAGSGLDVLVSGESRFETLPTTMAQLSQEAGALCHRIRYAPAS